MNQKLLEKLSAITPEEQEILNGAHRIDSSLYYRMNDHQTIDAKKVLSSGKMIDIRPHVRFVHFPLHRHNFVEFIYMCKGSTTHIVDGQEIILDQGNLLFLNQHARQEILPAGKDDIAINFMILPAFFDIAFKMISSEENTLRDFIISCLRDDNHTGNYLYFEVADILPIQNLIENLIYNMLSDSPQVHSLNQVTMGLLFLNLMNHTDNIHVAKNSFEQSIMIDLLRYIDEHYQTASLSLFSEQSGYDIYTLGRVIKKNTGRTFKELLQIKRLNQACFLLSNTSLSIAEISAAIGYDNTSFFHRLFRKFYDMSPRDYRLKEHPLQNHT